MAAELSPADWMIPLGAEDAAEIAAALADPTTPTSKAIVGSANVFTAQICKLTDQKPAEVCTSSGVTAAAAAIK